MQNSLCHFCFDDSIIYHGKYHRSTNFTKAGLRGRNYEAIYAQDDLRKNCFQQFLILSVTKDALREELLRSIPLTTPGFEKMLKDMWSKEVVYYTGGWYGGVALFSLTSAPWA